MRLLISRSYGKKQTTGNAFLLEGSQKLFEFVTLELPWLENKHNISCIPSGTYEVGKVTSMTKGKCFMVYDVPDRTNILIHKGNFTIDTQGCILELLPSKTELIIV
jgi:hypothetical protein